MMLEIDIENKKIKGTCKAGDIKKLGLIQASIKQNGVEKKWMSL